MSIGHVNDEIQTLERPQRPPQQLRSISGVVDVSADEPVDIGPPNGTW